MFEKVYKNPQGFSTRHKEIINTKINKFKYFTEVIVFEKEYDVWSGKMDHEIVNIETGELATKEQLRDRKHELMREIMGDEIAQFKIEEEAKRSKYESRKRAMADKYTTCHSGTRDFQRRS